MTLEEMQAVADICSTADNGCSVCANALMERLAKRFPDFEFAYGPEEFQVFHDWDDERECPSIYKRIGVKTPEWKIGDYYLDIEGIRVHSSWQRYDGVYLGNGKWITKEQMDAPPAVNRSEEKKP